MRGLEGVRGTVTQQATDWAFASLYPSTAMTSRLRRTYQDVLKQKQP